LFNFSANTNDTWEIPYTYPNACEDTIGQIRVVSKGYDTINGYVMKTIDIVSEQNSYWGFSLDTTHIIENIGPVDSYLLPEQLCVTDMHEGGMFRCFYSDEFGEYSMAYVSSCDFIFTSLVYNELNSGIRAWPNPFFDYLYVDSNPSSNNTKIIIYDLQGNIVKSLNDIKRKERIMLNDILPGMYILGFINNKTNSYIKIIKK
jgi:hypothetical protein